MERASYRLLRPGSCVEGSVVLENSSTDQHFFKLRPAFERLVVPFCCKGFYFRFVLFCVDKSEWFSGSGTFVSSGVVPDEPAP